LRNADSSASKPLKVGHRQHDCQITVLIVDYDRRYLRFVEQDFKTGTGFCGAESLHGIILRRLRSYCLSRAVSRSVVSDAVPNGRTDMKTAMFLTGLVIIGSATRVRAQIVEIELGGGYVVGGGIENPGPTLPAFDVIGVVWPTDHWGLALRIVAAPGEDLHTPSSAAIARFSDRATCITGR
jgi:hypothetical protein